MLSTRCSRVLATDLEWPGFIRILADELAECGKSLVVIPLRSLALERAVPALDIADLLVTSYANQGCDGLFLSAVSHLGVRVPIDLSLAALGGGREPRLVVVDGSQALGHVPSPAGRGRIDALIAGSHKWLASYRPLGMATFGGRVSPRPSLPAAVASGVGAVDDPLLNLVTRREEGWTDASSETVDLGSVFAARAAIAQALARDPGDAGFAIRRQNADLVAEAAAGCGWSPLRPDESMRSGILLLRSRDMADPGLSAELVRRRFHELGLILTCYSGGIVRMSMPGQPLCPRDVDRIRRVLRRIAPGGGRVTVGRPEEVQLLGNPEFRPVRPAGITEPAFRPRAHHGGGSPCRFARQEDGRDRAVGAGHDVEANLGAR
jgi:selenocysteine lyase/cysteine desulfurase